MRWLLLAGLAGCITNNECERRVDVAQTAGAEDGRACDLQVSSLVERDCGSADRTPELTYLAAWCGAAPVSCIEGDTAAQAVCWGAL